MEAINSKGEKFSIVEPESIPDSCPICHMTGTMQRLPGAYIRFRDGDGYNELLQLQFRCPRHKCGSMFLAEYDRQDNMYAPNLTWAFWRVVPTEFVRPTIQKEIQTISPSFVGLYAQALAAAHHGLTDVYGMALRKALEFLIKDYAMSKHPTEEADVKEAMLGPVIKKFVSDPNIRACAERATWLGNDETHYERRWAGHDVSDLQTLIQLTLNWISTELLTAKYVGTMKPK